MTAALPAQRGRAAAQPQAASAMVWRRRASLNRRPSASAKPETSPGGTRRPQPAGTVSGMAPAVVATTGMPRAIASAMAMPKPS